MRTQLIEQKIFKFEELEERAKYHAIERYNDLSDFDVNDFDSECWINMREYGIKEYKIGAWDTNPINCELSELDLDIDLLIARVSGSLKDQRNLYRCLRAQYSYQWDLNAIFRVSCRRGSCRSSVTDIDIDFPSTDKVARCNKLLTKYADKLNKHIGEIESTLAHAINIEVEYRQSEEYFQETANCNNWEFNSDGNLV